MGIELKMRREQCHKIEWKREETERESSKVWTQGHDSLQQLLPLGQKNHLLHLIQSDLETITTYKQDELCTLTM